MLASNTRVGYERLLREFHAWCVAQGRSRAPSTDETVILYLEKKRSEVKRGSLQVILSAIKREQLEAGNNLSSSARLTLFMRGLAKGPGESVKKTAATAEITRSMADTCDGDGLEGIRDRALILFMFGGAFRRIEVAGCRWNDVVIDDHEIRVFLQRSKNDPEGAGQTVVIPRDASSRYCPGDALLAWRDELKTADGSLFRSLKKRGYMTPLLGPVIAEIIKFRAGRAGFDADGFSGNSMRRGYITSHVRAGTPNDQIQRVTRHKSVSMISAYTESRDSIGRNLL